MTALDDDVAEAALIYMVATGEATTWTDEATGERMFQLTAKGIAAARELLRETVPVDPKLPARFSNTPNEARPPSHQRWWNRPYIETNTLDGLHAHWRSKRTPEELEKERAGWLEAWPSGTRYDVRCLDGGAWDRPTCWGMFATIEEAYQCAGEGPSWRRRSLTERVADARPPASER